MDGTSSPEAVRVILANPVYTGRSVWNRQRTERVLIDPDNPGLGHREVMRWNNPDQWIISSKPTHPGLISEEEFIAVQDMRAARGDARHGYLLTGLLRCAGCGRGMQAASTHGNAAYRCRHGYTSADTPDPGRSKNAYVRESHILARLPLLYLLLTLDPSPVERRPRPSAMSKTATLRPEEVIEYLREHALVLAYDPETRTLEVDGERTARVAV